MKIVLLQEAHGLPKGAVVDNVTYITAGFYLGNNRYLNVRKACSLEWENKRPKDMTPYELGEFFKYRAAGFPYYCGDTHHKKCNGFPWEYLCSESKYTSAIKNVKKINEIRKEMERLAAELKKLEDS